MKSEGSDTRTLERIFELNTSALTSIEAYFRLYRVAIHTGSYDNPEVIQILNEWLRFIKNQCSYDMDYLEEAVNETRDLQVLEQVRTARSNIEELSNIIQKALRQNTTLVGSR